MSITLRRFEDAGAFLEHAESWLLRSEAEHSLLLGLAARLAQKKYPHEGELYLAAIEDKGRMVGCAWCTPPHRVGITRMPREALGALVEDLLDFYDELPGVHGAMAQDFAELWGERRNLSSEIAMKLRIFQLETVLPPPDPPEGKLRLARPRDAVLATSWCESFSTEAGLGPGEFGEMIARTIAAGMLYFWDDGQPRSMAAAVRPTANGMGVNLVYTPEAWRGRGYASHCVAALSQELLDSGRRFCFLFTDLANPVSNSIYERIGYRPVCDVMDVNFKKESR